MAATKKAAPLAVTYRSTKELIPYARNARTHSEVQIKQIAASIQEFGFTNPVLIDGNDGIIAGHGRVMAAELLQMELVPTIQLKHLSEQQKRAYIIADNKMALNSTWDTLTLSESLAELAGSGDFDIGLTGFSMAEIGDLLEMDMSVFKAGSADDQGDLAQLSPKSMTCPKCGEEFEYIPQREFTKAVTAR